MLNQGKLYAVTGERKLPDWRRALVGARGAYLDTFGAQPTAFALPRNAPAEVFKLAEGLGLLLVQHPAPPATVAVGSNGNGHKPAERAQLELFGEV